MVVTETTRGAEHEDREATLTLTLPQCAKHEDREVVRGHCRHGAKRTMCERRRACFRLYGTAGIVRSAGTYHVHLAACSDCICQHHTSDNSQCSLLDPNADSSMYQANEYTQNCREGISSKQCCNPRMSALDCSTALPVPRNCVRTVVVDIASSRSRSLAPAEPLLRGVTNRHAVHHLSCFL